MSCKLYTFTYACKHASGAAVQELGAIERQLPADASTLNAEANAMGCCNIDCIADRGTAPGMNQIQSPLLLQHRSTSWRCSRVTHLGLVCLLEQPPGTTVRLHPAPETGQLRGHGNA